MVETTPQSRDKCPAYGSECKSCGKANHWARVCRSKPQPQRESRSRRRENPRARARSKTTDRQTRSQPPAPRALSDQFETITFGAMTVNSIESARDEVSASVNIKLRSDDNRHTALRAKLDTGAQENLLPLRVYRRMYPQNLTAEGYPKPNILAKSTTVLSAYGGTQLTQHELCKIPCEFNGKKSVASFFVTEAEGPAIIGLPTSLELDLGTLSCSVQKKSTPDGKSTAATANCIDNKSDLTASYPECFDGVGKFQGQ